MLTLHDAWCIDEVEARHRPTIRPTVGLGLGLAPATGDAASKTDIKQIFFYIHSDGRIRGVSLKMCVCTMHCTLAVSSSSCSPYQMMCDFPSCRPIDWLGLLYFSHSHRPKLRHTTDSCDKQKLTNLLTNSIARPIRSWCNLLLASDRNKTDPVAKNLYKRTPHNLGYIIIKIRQSANSYASS